jgi:hypothetical protein
MKVNVDIREGCVYITIGDWTVYLDNSTNEKIIESYNTLDIKEIK